MMLSAVILFLGVLLWSVNACLEWRISPGFQARIEAWRKGLNKKTHSFNCVWDLWPEEEELEKRVWHLQKELPQLRGSLKVPFRVKVQVRQSADAKLNEKYLSCLQRRFPEIEIMTFSLKREGDPWGDT